MKERLLAVFKLSRFLGVRDCRRIFKATRSFHQGSQYETLVSFFEERSLSRWKVVAGGPWQDDSHQNGDHDGYHPHAEEEGTASCWMPRASTCMPACWLSSRHRNIWPPFRRQQTFMENQGVQRIIASV